MRLKFEISGIVQGVGFRPFVAKLAQELSLGGFVLNTSNGVIIEIEGKSVCEFEQRLKNEHPKMARIDSFIKTQMNPQGDSKFLISKSVEGSSTTTFLPPDFSLCEICEKEILDPLNKRYNYAFINCTDCGPRYSIIDKLPFDRKNSAMQKFEICEDCSIEYQDYNDRRFHAQSICCPKCGPSLDGDLQMAAMLVKAGKTIAIKGVGGYNLICDATNENAVNGLRELKKRPHKPLAVMFKDIKTLSLYTKINNAEKSLVQSIEKPIVLVAKSDTPLAHNVSFESNLVGVFLPYSPLHLALINLIDLPIISSSANISSEPIITVREDITKRFLDIFTISHNRDIILACDDSVARLADDKTFFLRCARGFAPRSLKVKYKFTEPVLCVGSHQKNTIALCIEDFIIISPYIADLDNIASIERFEETIYRFKSMYGVLPTKIVCDAHPKYASTLYANAQDAKVISLQHHKAHFLAALYDNDMLEVDSCGVIWDGFGYGDDQTMWGGEFFTRINREVQRIGSLEPFYLLGGERAVKEPRLCALSLLFAEFGKDALKLNLPTIQAFSNDELITLWNAFEKKIGVIKTSSAGRLFDAAASLLGLLQISQYEGQSGLLLEAAYVKGEAYLAKTPKEIIRQLVEANNKKEAVGSFFTTLIKILFDFIKHYNLPIAASGGVFLNATIRNLAAQEAVMLNMNLKIHARPSDESISLGQAIYALYLKDDRC